MRAAVALSLVVACVAGCVAFVVGRLQGWQQVEEIGAWMTAPLWLVLGALSVVAFIALPAGALLRLLQRWRDRTQR